MDGVEKNVIHNQYRIEKNQQDITEIKEGCGRCIPQNVFRDIIEWYSNLTRRLILVVCILTAILFVSNVIWVVVWGAKDTNRKETTIITKDGVSNVIGHDGSIKEEGK